MPLEHTPDPQPTLYNGNHEPYTSQKGAGLPFPTTCRAYSHPQGKKAEREAAEIHRLEAAKRAALRHRKEREMEEQAKVVPWFFAVLFIELGSHGMNMIFIIIFHHHLGHHRSRNKSCTLLRTEGTKLFGAGGGYLKSLHHNRELIERSYMSDCL